MEKEKIPAYRVAQAEDKIILAKFDKNDLAYTDIEIKALLMAGLLLF